jgi:hypothetical protein
MTGELLGTGDPPARRVGASVWQSYALTNSTLPDARARAECGQVGSVPSLG